LLARIKNRAFIYDNQHQGSAANSQEKSI